MPNLIAYLLGVLTPVAMFMFYLGAMDFSDWRAGRRYQRAWDKFTADFARLEDWQLEIYRRRWAEESYRFAHYSSDRDRYFVMKWNGGHTTEI